MDIWIILNGEKTGPIHDYEIRHKIEDGQLEPTTPAWHEGLPTWLPLVEIDLFRREFQLPPPIPEHPSFSESLPDSDQSLPPQPPPSPLLGRRFWARWFDLCLYSGIWWISMWATGRDIRGMMGNAWVVFPHYIPWFILETLLLHHFGTTPGKWLLGLKVTNLDGSLLSLGAATRRSARVLFTGIGFGWGLLTVFCQVLSFFTTKRLGNSLWDHAGGHRVSATPLRPERLMALVFLYFGALVLQFIVVSPYILEAMAAQEPQLKEQFEKIPSWWYLPKRH